MEETCLFSIIIPTFNRGRILRDALESVFVQGVPEIEVIVVDDGSTDDTKAVVGAYGGRVKYVYQENQGPAAAKNEGIRRARGRYVAFLDSDDVWLPGKLRTELEHFRAFPTADVVISNCESWMENTLLSDSWLREQIRGAGSGPALRPRLSAPTCLYLATGKLFATCCMTLKRRVLHRLGREPFDVSLRSFEDWDFEIRLLRISRVLILPEVLAKVRRFDDGTRLDRPFPIPNSPYTPDQYRIATHRWYKILEKTLAMGGWSEDVLAQLYKAKRAMAEQMARFALRTPSSTPRGWPMHNNAMLRKLGFDAQDRVVIIHADDIGMCQATLSAFADLVDAGLVSSGAVMVPMSLVSRGGHLVS